MILVQEKIVPDIKRTAPRVAEPYKGLDEKQPHRFYRRTALSLIVAGYRDGPRDPYVEKLMSL